MLVKTLVVGHYGTNCYVVTDENSLDCAVIDPGAEVNTIMDYIEENKLKCRAILLTHAHFDHIGALPELIEETGAPLYMSENELGTSVGSFDPGFTAPEGTVFVREQDIVKAGTLNFVVVDTPGHTAGGLSYVCGDALFTGDTLFRGSCGRTDLPGGDMRVQLASLKKLGELNGDYDVYPGHMEYSRLSTERAHNPYMRRALGRF